MRLSRAALALLGMLALGSRPASSQRPNTLTVFLVTLGEGKYYWEKFGHNALWFYDPARGLDLAYNWGTFDFAEPGFLGRVLTGNMRYWVDTVSSTVFFDYYRHYDRSITVQRLNLTPEQASRALEFSRWNARAENKYYQYDYFRDNCSTRVRDVIDLALGGALKRATASARTDHTYRRESVRLVDDMKLTQFGINAALGRPADTPLSVWEDMFVPARMQQALANLTVPAPNGGLIRVVAEERVLYESRTHAERATTPSLVVRYLILGMLAGATILVAAILGERKRGWEILFRVASSAWAAMTGILGLVILLAWMITAHVFWFRNENLLLFNPFALFLAVLIPLSGRPRWRRPAAICAIVLAMLAALALFMKGLPVSVQENLAIILLVLPAQFAVAYALWRRARAPVALPATT